MTVSKLACRVCGISQAVVLGSVEYLQGFNWQILECGACGCRFTGRAESVHAQLHEAPAISYYKDYLDLANRCAALFRQRDREGLKGLLRQWSKYRFVIDEVERASPSARLLEVGCSRGYLASCFILEGRTILGVDVSARAVQSATHDFGEHFAVAAPGVIEANAPYDVIYHVGMIGCVPDPITLTKQLLAALKPGGRLLFNAPNRNALHLRGQLWLDTAPPPDLVTLFPPGFWTRHFAADAIVSESIEWRPAEQAMSLWMDRLLGRSWVPPVTAPPGASGHVWGQTSSRGWLERATRKLATLTGLATLAPRHPADFGLFVSMTAR